MNSNRIKSIVAGILIILAYAVLISTLTNSKTLVMGAELICGLSVIGIALIMFPLFKPYNKSVSNMYFGFRWAEGILIIITGILFVAGGKSMLELRSLIYAVHDYIFAIGALFFYYLLLKSRIIPAWLSIWGFLASIIVIISNLLGALEVITPSMLLFLPIILNELLLAVWLIAKGLKIVPPAELKMEEINE